MATTIYEELSQGTDEWLQARCGLVTASTVGALVTKETLGAIEYLCPKCMADIGHPCIGVKGAAIKTIHPERNDYAKSTPVTRLIPSNGDMAHTLMNTLIAERITGRVEFMPMNRAMQRGVDDEPYARAVYADNHAPVAEVGFIVNDDHGFKLGYSPDGLVGDDGLIEIKSRDQKTQLRQFLSGAIPSGNVAQLQMGLLVTGRKWIDYVSYSGGMPLFVKRVYPDPEWHKVILEAVSAFEAHAGNTISWYLHSIAGAPETVWIDHYADELGVTF